MIMLYHASKLWTSSQSGQLAYELIQMMHLCDRSAKSQLRVRVTWLLTMWLTKPPTMLNGYPVCEHSETVISDNT